MAVNIPGVIAIVVFYLLVLGTGIWATVKSKRKQKKCAASGMEMALLGNRSISLVVGVLTMTATWVGGGTVLGIAEMLYTPSRGLISAISMLTAYASTFIIGGLFFAKPMRDQNFVTILDPFRVKYGRVISGIMGLVSVLNDIMWMPITLTALGGTMSVVLDLPFSLCVWISVAVAITYTLLGGLYSVAYTDVIQLVLIFCSLALGGLASQCFQQRILSSFSGTTAKISCLAAAIAYLVLGIPLILLGAGAVSTGKNNVDKKM
ncbi:unnamed protein product [Tetraodon nigroviridis]|uniref:(spotted green pufferfish) hypothetical protein n=1 Tax=Tetraodon nigroviridis TaxID=99883 RepID=Q4S2J1_TETNG|nr:unnamed protein product [Tetraodon nigroviridis]